MDLTGKRLLVLGGTSASLDIVKQAKKLGIYTIVTDEKPVCERVSKQIADEYRMVSTTDFDGLRALIQDDRIDGVFCGPSEFNIRNMIELCEQTGLRCYCSSEQWDICSNKARFKELCKDFGVPCVPEYHLTAEMNRKDLDAIRYPVVIKPVDASSSAGLYVCWDEDELRRNVPKSLATSKSGQIIVEKCITSDYGFGCRYIASDGEIYLSAVNDRYTVDSVGGKALISSAALFPSKMTEGFIEKINLHIIRMFKSIRIKNGTMFMQALVDQEDGQIYFHEMGYRLSGGLIFTMLESSCGYNDLQMMLRFALGGPMATPDEIEKIDPYMHGYYVGSLTVPLKAGVIGKIAGIDEVRQDQAVLDFVQYYHEGDTLEEKYIGTLVQHFCRIKIMTRSEEEFQEKVNLFQSLIKIEDTDGNSMIYRLFDTNRMR